MNTHVIGLESSSIMPMVAITPLTQDCYDNIWGRFANSTLIAHDDSIAELKSIFEFKANTFYSNPIERLKKIEDFLPSDKISLKGMAIKLLLDGQMGGWVGNKHSRVQTFFFSDVIDRMDDTIKDPREFGTILIERMRNKISMYNSLLTPISGTLTIDIRQILPYWGFHNITSTLFSEKRKIRIKILPNCETFTMFEPLPSGTRRDAYHYHMLKKERILLILVGDANYKKNVCSCRDCLSYSCEVQILSDRKRKKILGLI